MSKARLTIVAAISMLMGFSAAVWDPLHAQDGAKSCSIARNFGTVKAVWGDRLVFENDQSGTIRVVDERCRVRQIIQKGGR